MHKFSRTLLLAGVLAVGTLSAACGDKVEIAGPATGVQLVTVTPSSASLPVGSSIILSGQVTADAASAKTVTWSTSSAAVATVDANGKVTGVSGGTASITATATADPTKAASAVITVTPVAGPVVPTIGINGVTQGGVAVNLGNTAGQIDVAVNTSGGGLIEAFLSSNCTSNSIAATDKPVASQTATSAQAGTITLSFNTAQLTAAGAPLFPNGAYCIKTRLTNGTQVVIATNTVPVTLNNLNTFSGKLAFVGAPQNAGAPTSAVSTLNGLNYNQGSLTATINPVIFTSASPAALITGYMTKKGEQGGVAVSTVMNFTNLAVTSGASTITFPDTAGAVAATSIYQYTSLPAGDTLYIVSATDAAGNPISVPTPVAIPVASGVRIDNDIPVNTGATYTVIANNGYVGAAYKFSSGTAGTPAADTRGGVQGVGGVTTTYYIGAAGSAAFTTPNSCVITGLTVASTGAALDNTTVATADAAKVIVSDALGNKICADVNVTTLAGPSATFGVDKIPPIAVATTANSGASDKTGYTTGSAKNFSFVYNDSGSAKFSSTQPLTGTLVRNFTITQASDCQLGTYDNTAKTCVAAPITVTSTFGVPPNAGGSVSMTNGTSGAAGSSAYYTITATPVDLAGNVGAPVTRIAAYDTIAPVVAAPAAPAAIAPLASVTLTGAATDNLDLATAKGDLVYATAPLPIAGPAATSFGTLFDPTLVQSAAATAVITNVYRGLQSTTAGVVQPNTAPPTGTLTVTDVGTNSFTSPATPIPTTTAAANILTSTSVTFAVTPTSAAPATTQASTTLTVNLSGAATDIPFQSQPFAQVEVFKVVGSELVRVASIAQTINTYTSATVGGTQFYTYVLPGIALTATATNTFYVIGVAPTGDAVISPAIVVTNP